MPFFFGPWTNYLCAHLFLKMFVDLFGIMVDTQMFNPLLKNIMKKI